MRRAARFGAGAGLGLVGALRLVGAPGLVKALGLVGVFGLMGALALAGAGCVDERKPLGPGPLACKDGDCSVGAGIGVGVGIGGTGGAGEGGATNTSLEGSVFVVGGEALDTSTLYAEEATIHAPLTGGGEVTASYGGAAGTTFSLDGIASGASWLLVQDETLGATGILSTYSVVVLPSASSVSVPVLDAASLQSIAMTVGAGFVDPDKVQIVLRVRRGGSPLAGISVTSIGSGVIAYDEGPGIFSAGAAATGSAGVIVVLNATPEGPQSTLSMKLGEGAKSYVLAPMPAPVGGAAFQTLSL